MNRRAMRQRGAALLLAMLTVTLVATLAAGAAWQQWRDVEVESTERARVQAAWMLGGALDWSRLILREDFNANRNGTQMDHLGEPWAVPLQEARLSTFLAADRDNTVPDAMGEREDVFLSGSILDAQARLNLRDLFTDSGKPDDAWLQSLQRLCAQLGLPEQEAQRIATGLLAAWQGDAEGATLMPERLDEIAWLGVSPQTLERLAPYTTLLPARTAVNLNTASAPVLAAVLDTSVSVAQRLVAARAAKPFRTPVDAMTAAGVDLKIDPLQHGVSSSYFEVRGRLRLQQAAVEEHSLLRRDGPQVSVLWRERGALGVAQALQAATAQPR